MGRIAEAELSEGLWRLASGYAVAVYAVHAGVEYRKGAAHLSTICCKIRSTSMILRF